jgi:hypothetical protein
MYTLRNWQQTRKDPRNLIVQASTQDGKDGWTEFPIGMGFAWNGTKETSFIGDHSNLVLCALSTASDNGRARNGVTRLSVVNTLKEVGIPNIKLHPSEYFQSLPSYKFVISPEGNGIDCHRHYEALIAGCIPIVEYHLGIAGKYGNCPILYTRDYSEITPEYLEAKYAEMIDKEYDFSKLFLSSYPLHIQRQIKENGDYWMRKLTGKPFYANKLLPFLRI